MLTQTVYNYDLRNNLATDKSLILENLVWSFETLNSTFYANSIKYFVIKNVIPSVLRDLWGNSGTSKSDWIRVLIDSIFDVIKTIYTQN